MPFGRGLSRVTALRSRIERIRVRKRTLASRLHEHAPVLAEGVWWVLGESIARHSSVRELPQSLQLTKNRSAPNTGSMTEFLRRLVFFCIPPFRVRVERDPRLEPSADQKYSILLLTRANGTVAFDLSANTVARLGASAQIDVRLLALRERLASYLVLPEITLHRPGEVLVERFARGLPMHSLSAETREEALDTLVGQCVALFEEHRQGEPESDFWLHALAVFRALELPAVTRQAFEALPSDVTARFDDLGFCIAHGDLSGANVLVSADGPMLIDVEDCAVLPAFYDLFFLAHHEALSGRDGPWQKLVTGAGFNTLCRALQRHSDAEEAVLWEAWLWASFIAQCFVWARKVGSPPLTTEVLASWWAPLAQSLANGAQRRETLDIACSAL